MLMFPLAAVREDDEIHEGYAAALDHDGARELAASDTRLQGFVVTVGPAIDDVPLRCAPGVYLAGEQWL